MKPPSEFSVHLTSPQPYSDATSVWPALGAFGLLFVAAGLVVGWFVSLVGIVMGVAAIVGVVRELREAHVEEGERAPEARETPGDWWLQRSKHAWLAIGIAGVDLMAFVAIFRAFSAHGLFMPEPWPEAGRGLLGAPALVMTLALVGALGASIWGARRVYEGRPRAVLPLGLSIGAGALFLAALAWEWWALLESGFLPSSGPAGSGYYALTGWMALNVLAMAAFVGAIAWRTSTGEFAGGRNQAVRGIVPFWVFLAVMWVLVLLVMYLRVIPWDGRFLI